MRFIIGLSGTHGTGKSTILQGVKKAKLSVVETQLSREAQKALGWESLQVDSVTKMWDLQEAILGAMFDRDAAIQKSKTLTMVERTPADAMAYTRLWCQRLGIHPDDPHLRDYRQRCYTMAYNYLAFMLVPQTPKVKFVEDPNRADLASRQFVDSEIRAFFRSVEGLYMTPIVNTTKKGRIAEALAVMGVQQALLHGD